jgi:hypothetical protein
VGRLEGPTNQPALVEFDERDGAGELNSTCALRLTMLADWVATAPRRRPHAPSGFGCFPEPPPGFNVRRLGNSPNIGGPPDGGHSVSEREKTP